MTAARLATAYRTFSFALALFSGRAQADALLAADAPGAGAPLATVVVQATALPGTNVDADKIPGNVQSFSAADLGRDGSPSLTRALTTRLGSISVNDNLDDQFQPDILYRGFEASPVLGTPQGLAVYQNGVRINEAFGNTVNWDLFPDIAINRVDLVSSNPVYGLNALGGAISVSMKNGFSYGGGDLELSGGSWDQRSAAAEFGAASDNLAVYVAGRALDQNGWRLFTGDVVRQFYAALSARSEMGTLDLSYTHADNRLFGQGSAPVQELAVNRDLVFTGPQANLNRLDFVTLDGTARLSDSWSLQGVLYYRQYRQRVANGNGSDYTACAAGAYSGSLCQPDATTPVRNSAGAPVPDISEGGALPVGENDFETISSYSHGATLQLSDSGSIGGHSNAFSAGAVLDQSYVNFYSAAQLGVIDSQLIVLPSNLIVDTPESSPFGGTPVSLNAISRTYGFYATDTIDATTALAVTASARYNVATIDLTDRLGTNLTGDNRYAHFNPALGATYKLSAALTAYAGVSQNARTPTASEIECSNPLLPCLLPSNLAGDPPTLRQVVAQTIEFGFRGSAPSAPEGDGALSWNLGAFRTTSFDDIYGIATSVSSGFFQNIGSTRRQGIEAGATYRASSWSVYASYSFVDATFRSALTLPSPSNPYQDGNGNVQVEPGDRLPGLPRNRLKTGADLKLVPHWTLGASVTFVGPQYYFGDESNQLGPMAGYHVVGLHASFDAGHNVELYASISNLLNAKYATYGILGDPTGVGTPGIPLGAVSNGPGVDNRFQSPAAPLAFYGGIRIRL